MTNKDKSQLASNDNLMISAFNSIIFILGTRPEAIKLAPIILESQKLQGTRVEIILTGQHPTMCISALESFGIRPTRILNTIKAQQPLLELSAKILFELSSIHLNWKEAIVIVQGDTTSALLGAYAGFIMGSKVAHIEAGLRTHDARSPFPEEMNRRLITRIADMHFCATDSNAENLLSEGITKETIYVTGNTIIDALTIISSNLAVSGERESILITLHRRENHTKIISEVTKVINLLSREEGVNYSWKVIKHPNPASREGYSEEFLENPNIQFLDPLQYPEMIEMLKETKLIITDSGGFQEEATYLGIPTLIVRNETERPEALASGVCTLVKDPTNELKKAILELVLDEEKYFERSRPSNIFGDGKASSRIIGILKKQFTLQ